MNVYYEDAIMEAAAKVQSIEALSATILAAAGNEEEIAHLEDIELSVEIQLKLLKELREDLFKLGTEIKGKF